MYSSSLRAVCILLLVLTVGCSNYIPSFYTVPIRQGNYIDQETVAKLYPGMSKQQVQRILGTPLITDPFHQERWDYYYQYGKGAKISEQRRITLYFNNETLDRVEDRATNDNRSTN